MKGTRRHFRHPAGSQLSNCRPGGSLSRRNRMLVLSRRLGERIHIGDDVVIT
ncbi:MAG: carbon storage regulator, partial [Fuerstiella sp.]|nr:carbon storage regulator [Fuerstiella sp.]